MASFRATLMRLTITFRAFAVIQVLSVLATLVVPEAKMESFGLSYTSDTLLFMQFSAVSQLMLALVTFALPSWLGTNLWKAAPTYVWLSLLPLSVNVYHVIYGIMAITSAFYVENIFWLAFATAFYSFGKRMKLRF
jgi:hypothetical protein